MRPRWLKRTLRLLVPLMAGAGSRAMAQHPPGTVEVGGYAQVNVFDESLRLNDATGGGARLGVFVRPKLSLEFTAAYAQTGDSSGRTVSYFPLAIFATFHLPIRNDLEVLLAPGYVHTTYGKDADFSDDGFAALAGLRFRLSRRFALRVEGRADYFADPANGASNNVNYGVLAGISAFFGKRPRHDTDGDGIADRDDQCPATPPGTAVDPTGCAVPRDRDGDGVLDASDRCPDTPPGQRIDREGCPIDSDNDGVVNNQDRCPETPEGEPVDLRGCPVPRDRDRDGVIDTTDLCPGTPFNSPVDDRGCLLVQTVPEPLVLECVHFRIGLSVLSPQAQATLRRVARSLQEHPEVRVEISGHTDITGPPALNQRLSRDRAEAVRRFVIELGVDPSRIATVWYGPAKPIASNDTVDGRALNRRAEFRAIE